MRGLNKSGRSFLHHILLLFLSIPGRINFLQLGRYSDQYVESSCRLHFEAEVDFASLNREYITQNGSGHYVLAFDPTYISKSGKATPGVGKYWSGKAQQGLWGLEGGLLSVVDVVHHTAFHLDVVQTPDKAERVAKDISLAGHYAQVLIWNREHCEALSRYVAVDGYFAKADFINPVLERTSLHVLSAFRQDANLYYLYQGAKRPGRGAPRKYDGKMDCQAPDLERFKLQYADENQRIWDILVYCKFLQRTVRLAYVQYLNEQGEVQSYQLLFSTDVNLPAWMIVRYYRARFQQEFLIRDAKHHTGLQHCQARSIHKIDYHWNAALTAVNVAKIEHWIHQDPKVRGSFSLATIKILYHNQLLINRIFDNLPPQVKMLKNNPRIRELYYLGAIAA
jgi:hypothetical protein